MMDNIKKKILEEFHIFLIFLQLVGFELTYLPNPNRDVILSTYRFVVF